MEDGKLVEINSRRGAPCGATWKAARKVTGMEVSQAVIRMGLETQFFCSADPAGWDPIMEKSPVHFAGAIHARALARAVKKVDPEAAAKVFKLL